MNYFFRSLRYLLPYKKRLIVSFVLVVFIAILWSGGLTMALPGLKVLFSEEGLHGWAWREMSQDRLDARLIYQPVDKEISLPNETIFLNSVLYVVDMGKTGPGEAAGLKKFDWLIGLRENGKPKILGGEAMARRLAEATPGKPIEILTMTNGNDQAFHTVDPGDLSWKAETLGGFANAVDPPKDRLGRFPLLIKLLLIALGVSLLRNFFRFVQEYLVQTAVLRGIWDLRDECFNVALRQPVTFFATSGTTDTTSRFIQDTGELTRALETLLGKTLVEPAKMLASLFTALLLDWQMTLVACVGGPVAYVVVRKFGKLMRKSTKRALENWSDLLAVLEETLQGIRVVKAYTMEAQERKRFYRVNRQLFKQQRRIARVDAATAPSVEALGISAALVATSVAGYQVLKGELDPEMFMTWGALLAAMFDPVRKLSKVATRFQRGDAAAERLFNLRDQETEKRIPGSPMLPRHQYSIELRDLTFRYPNADVDAVSHLDLTIQAGHNLAIVGPNGCGKTTLVSMIPRLLEPTCGNILFDGCDIHDFSIRSLRRQIAIVTQETVIFNATIFENIAYGLRRPKPEDVIAAAEQAFVAEFVRELPEGYDTMVGQRGATLSGGQRQRISIARAILRDPAILIFDEALSQIDPDSEKKIAQAMKEFIKGRTTLTIAHRFSSILNADSILVMNDGQIVDIGSHNDLMHRCELYQQLYNTQLVKDE